MSNLSPLALTIAQTHAAGGWEAVARLVASKDAEIADLKTSVIAFCAPWAAEYAREYGLPPMHLHHTHYDILESAGARMDDFGRGVG